MLYIGGITMFHIFIMYLLLIIVEVNMEEIHQLFVCGCVFLAHNQFSVFLNSH
jgi:hypothetical protein